jgi:AAHS family 4-hydroxybenzoate transporter-like MFS transporter
MTASDATERLTIGELIDRAPLKPYLIVVPILATLLMIFEGVDSFSVGFISPLLNKHYGITSEQLGFIYSGTVIASLIGAVFVAPLADRVGRKPILLGCCAVMGPATIMTALSDNVFVFFAMRCVIGLAFGCTLPTLMAQVGDYAPKRCRTVLVMLINSGIAFGGIVSGLLAATIVPVWGWQTMLIVAGTVSALFTFVLAVLMPESLEFLLRQDPNHPKARALIARVARGASVTIVPPPPLVRTKTTGTPVDLFTGGRAVATTLLWFTMTMTYVAISFDGYWMPTVVMQNGLTMQQTGFVLSAMKFISLGFGFVLGWMADRWGMARLVVFSFFGSAIAEVGIAALAGFPTGALAMLLLAGVLGGLKVSGTHAITVSSYPPELRATAGGWLTGTTRLVGGGMGTIIGGFIVGAKLGFAEIALIFAAITFLAGVAIHLQQKRIGASDRAERQPAKSAPAAVVGAE